MSDLIKRLRDSADSLLGIQFFESASNVVEAADAIERQDAAIADLVQILKEAKDMVGDWGLYASVYYQEKHGLKDDLAKLRAAITKYDTTTKET